MIRAIALFFKAILATAIAASAETGPEAVFAGDIAACQVAGHRAATEDWYDCLGATGASPEAVAFVRATDTAPGVGMPAFLTGFLELGAVDLGDVFLPLMANTNAQQAVLNADGGPITLPALLSGARPGRDAGTRAVLARFPEAFPSGRLTAVAHRVLPNGRQRLVVTDVLTDGCRACDIAGTQIARVEFDGTRLAAVEVVGWTLPAPGGDPVARLIHGGPVALQTALNLAGYDAGPIDGVPGRRTEAALADFRGEFCLAGNGPVSPSEARLLVSANRLQGVAPQRPPCALQPDAPASAARAEAQSPLTVSSTPSALFLDPAYLAHSIAGQPPAQHLGLDLPAADGAPVVSPVSGVVLVNRTDRPDPFDAYLVIVDTASAAEHVLGHIRSDLAPGTPLTAGDPVGRIVSAGSGPHLHWGVNRRSVLASLDPTAGWGWGRGPGSATAAEAAERGWVDPLALLGLSAAPPAAARTRRSPSEIEARAIEILLGDPYGRTPEAVRSNIRSISFGPDPVCGQADAWVVEVSVPPGRFNDLIEGYLVIDDENPAVFCAGLPFLD